MKLRGWMFLLPLPFLAIILMVVILSRWGGWIATQLVVSTFGTAVLIHDANQHPATLSLALVAIWAAATTNVFLYVRHVARRQSAAHSMDNAHLDLTPYRGGN